jgi:hypothetical protein
VSVLREKFDRRARENTERYIAETRRNRYKKRSASLEPTPSPDDIQQLSSEGDGAGGGMTTEQSIKEIRGRRSRRLSVESYFHVDKSTSSRAHSLSPLPSRQQPSATRGSGCGSPSSPSSSISPTRQRAHAIIFKFDEDQQRPHERESASRHRSGAVESNLPPKTHQSPSTPRGNGGGVESDFLMKYKPDNENKVHFTMRELLALRLLFSLFDR